MLIILGLFLLPFTLHANYIVDEANIYINKNQLWKARTLYSNYLDKEKVDNKYYNVLLEASYIEPSIDDTIILINKYKSKISNKQNAIDLNIYLANLYEFKGDLLKAITAYEDAFVLSNNSRIDIVVQKITLLLDTGDLNKAKEHIDKIYNQSPLPYLVKNKLLASMISLYTAMSSSSGVINIINNEKNFIESQGNALLIYSIYFFYMRLMPANEQLKILKNVLSKKFVNSLESKIINDKAKNYLSPIYLW